jgi:hypothetical protein
MPEPGVKGASEDAAAREAPLRRVTSHMFPLRSGT